MRLRWMIATTFCTVAIVAACASQVRAGEDEVRMVGKDGLKITASVAANDPKVKVTEPDLKVSADLHAKVYQVKLQGGVKYRMELSAKDFDPVLVVQDGAGKQLAFNDDIAIDNLNSRLEFTPAADGIFRIVTASLKDVGPFTLTIGLAGAGGTPVAFKDIKVEGQVSPADDPVAITNAAVDKKIGLMPGNMTVNLPAKLHSVKLDAGTYQFDVIPKDKVDPIIVVQDGAGKQLGFDDDGGGFPNSRLILKATKTDTYKVYVGTIGGQGKYTLTIKQTAGGKTDPPAKVHEVGAAGLKIEGKLDGATKVVPYNVKLEGGKTYVIDMISPNQAALDPYLVLEDAAGKKLAQDDDGGGQLQARITFTATATGTYRILATSFGNAGNGAFNLNVQLKE